MWQLYYAGRPRLRDGSDVRLRSLMKWSSPEALSLARATPEGSQELKIRQLAARTLAAVCCCAR